MKLIEPISAITSWEDYDYQGHVALYYSLKLMYEAIISSSTTSDMILQLEGEEDFAICKNDQFVSLHQVKAGAISLGDNDKFSFIIEILENKAEKDFFHIAKGRRIPSDFVSTTKSYIETLERKVCKPLIEEKNLNSGDNEDDYIVVERISGNHKKADVYRIIKYVVGGSKKVADISNAIAIVQDELLKHKETIDNNDDVDEKQKVLEINQILSKQVKAISSSKFEENKELYSYDLVEQKYGMYLDELHSAIFSIILFGFIYRIFVAKNLTHKKIDTKYDTKYNIDRRYSRCQSGINY